MKESKNEDYIIFKKISVDDVGVVLACRGGKWILTVSGSKEYVVDLDCINQEREQALTTKDQEIKKVVEGLRNTPRVRRDFCKYCDEVLLEFEVCGCDTEVVRQETLDDVLKAISK